MYYRNMLHNITLCIIYLYFVRMTLELLQNSFGSRHWILSTQFIIATFSMNSFQQKCQYSLHRFTYQAAVILVVIILKCGFSEQIRNITYEGFVLDALCQPSDEIRYPKTNGEVVAIVKEALKRGTTVKAFGSRHSSTDIICTDGIPISMTNFQNKVFHNEDYSATFGAGVSMYDVGVFLKDHGRALRTVPTYANITVAGASGTGAHGHSIKHYSTLSDQIIKMTIVDGLGNIQIIKCGHSLKAFRVHLGLLGIILDITVKTVPFYKVRVHIYQMTEEILLDGRVEAFAKQCDQLLVVWGIGVNTVVVLNHTFVDATTPGDAFANIAPHNTREENLKAIYGWEALQKLPPTLSANLIGTVTLAGFPPLLTDGSRVGNPIYTEDGITTRNPAVGDWNRLTTGICPAEGRIQCVFLHGGREAKHNFTFDDFSLPLSEFPNVVKRIKAIMKVSPIAFPNGGLLFRFSGASDTYMSMSEGRDTVHVEFDAFKRLNEYEDPSAWLPAYQTFRQSMMMELNGRTHWGKNNFVYHTREMLNLNRNKEATAAFLMEMKRYDPNEVFMNKFGRRLKGYGTEADFDPKTTHCALLDNCVCQGNRDCGKLQKCTTLPGFNYNVCKNILPG